LYILHGGEPQRLRSGAGTTRKDGFRLLHILKKKGGATVFSMEPLGERIFSFSSEKKRIKTEINKKGEVGKRIVSRSVTRL